MFQTQDSNARSSQVSLILFIACLEETIRPSVHDGIYYLEADSEKHQSRWLQSFSALNYIKFEISQQRTRVLTT